MQIIHHPHNYTAEMAMCQVALYMLRHPYKYFKCVEQELLRSGELYESYCYNVFNKNVWGDNFIAAVFGDMWNVAISIVTPISRKPIALFHNKDNPDVVIVANGGCYMMQKGCTHFTATRSTDLKFKQPGSEYMNPTISQDITAKLEPVVLADREDAEQAALKQYLHTGKERSVDLLRGVCTQIKRLDNRICDMIKESDMFREQKDLLEYQLEKLGVSMEKLRDATNELSGDRGYVRTEEREMLDIAADKKRKAEEQLKEQELKKQKVIAVGEGLEDVETVQGAQAEVEETYHQKLARQQQEIIKQYETLLQQQQNRLVEQEQELEQHRQQEQKQQPQQGQTWSEVIEGIRASSGKQKPSTSRRASTIDNYLSAKGITYLPPDVKKDITEKVQISEDFTETVEEDVIITEVTKKMETVKYISTKVPGIENYVLVQAPRTKTTVKRSSVAGPVPEKLRNPVKFYCEKCPCFYTRPDELARHKKRNCLKEDPEYFCNVCHRGFFYENTVREHYYHEHTDIVLWHCKKCNEGFHYKSNRSKHRHACPNKDGADIYQGRAPYDEELEETFKAKTAIPVKIPTDPQPEAQPEDQPLVEDQPLEVEDQPQQVIQIETETAVGNIAESGTDILNRLAAGQVIGNVEDNDKPKVKKEVLEVEMEFDD